ncbi:MAG: hypothetical protein A2X32_06135 [Elusimicrobia bacterium GWC2_64_44]|nr:MAG: hypothetical protein A2X32_06135 [Elusimicrobia bacterium GWC2_64_44]
MRKRWYWLAFLAAAVFLAWRFGYQAALRYFFRVSGTVSVAQELLPAVPGANSMLFVVARNDRGVPVAVQKIINPVFPAGFELAAPGLIMPDLLTRRVYLEALLNTHGQLGVFRRGDLKGELSGRVDFISKGVELRLDSQAK